MARPPIDPELMFRMLVVGLAHQQYQTLKLDFPAP
jgi:hypothetical protein